MKLEVSLFRFDYKSDYLPYYTKNFLKIKNEKTLLDILNTINEEHPFSYKNSENFCLVVNGFYTKASTSIEHLVKELGNDLIIEPVSIRRACNDLEINDEDFQEKLELFKDFTSQEDILKYQQYKLYFYASNTFSIEYDYIGDALILLAYDLIQKNNSNEKAILKILASQEIGTQFHTSLENRVFNFDVEIENKIDFIRKKIGILESTKNIDFNLEKAKDIKFEEFNEIKEIKHDFKDFNLAYFKGLKEDSLTQELISRLNAKQLNIPSLQNDLALNTFHINKEFSYKLAAKVIMDAFDNAADLLIVDSEESFKIFDSNRKALSKACGREVILPVLHKSELALLAFGEHEAIKQSLKKHSINPEII